MRIRPDAGLLTFLHVFYSECVNQKNIKDKIQTWSLFRGLIRRLDSHER